jgi:branched-chain amino acid transport system substrate-binding protein
MPAEEDVTAMKRALSIPIVALATLLAAPPSPRAQAIDLAIPILVPITGFLALEGTSQRNGALLALDAAPAAVTHEVLDTAAAPETAVNAFERALRGGKRVGAVVAPILGTQMLALLPLAAEAKVPLVTISGTARLTEAGNPWIFRFFPNDAAVKIAHARYIAETVAAKRPALLYQTTAYGQSGRQHLVEQLTRRGAAPVYEEAVAPTARDLSPALTKAMAANPDVLVLHLHAPSTALAIRQARTMGVTLPIVAGSAMHQPATAKLLEPSELKGVCAETASSPISGGSAEIERFAAAYRQRFNDEPDAFALAQHDGVMMVLAAITAGARDSAAVREHLATRDFKGLAMAYRSDGAGNMAHDAVIVCYDGLSRVPRIIQRYGGLGGS